MPTGLSGDSSSTTAGEQTAQLSLIEQRVLSQLLLMAQGSIAIDSLSGMRNDEAYALGITPFPIPGIS